jgi:hypothetical protein
MILRSFILIAVLNIAIFSVLYPQEKIVKVDNEILTLVFAFGCEAYGTKGDFLLETPRNISVNDKNDIIVFDKYYIKIYDSKGKGKKIIGGRGQGPGEFDTVPILWSTSPATYFTVLESYYYSIFDNNLKFIDKRRISNDKGLKSFLQDNNINTADMRSIESMFVYGKNEKIYQVSINVKPHQKCAILYEKEGNVKPILFKDNKNTLYKDSFMQISEGPFGRITYIPIPGKMIVYSDNYEEDFGDGKKGVYQLHIVSLNDLSEKIIKKEFIPIKFDGTYLEGQKRSLLGKNPTQRDIDRFEMIKEFHDKKVYYPHVSYSKNDSTFIFVLNFRYLAERGQQALYDVFDALSGKYISSFISPFTLGYIRNGYVYITGMHESGYYEIQVYKLNPKIYGK